MDRASTMPCNIPLEERAHSLLVGQSESVEHSLMQLNSDVIDEEALSASRPQDKEDLLRDDTHMMSAEGRGGGPKKQTKGREVA